MSWHYYLIAYFVIGFGFAHLARMSFARIRWQECKPGLARFHIAGKAPWHAYLFFPNMCKKRGWELGYDGTLCVPLCASGTKPTIDTKDIIFHLGVILTWPLIAFYNSICLFWIILAQTCIFCGKAIVLPCARLVFLPHIYAPKIYAVLTEQGS